jgi:hypothetical protein
MSLSTLFSFLFLKAHTVLLFVGLYKAVLTHDKLLMNLIPTRKVKVVL